MHKCSAYRVSWQILPIIAVAAHLFVCAGCTTVKTYRPEQETWEWLCANGMTNDPALVYAYSPVKFVTLGQATLNDAIPVQSGAIIARSATCDNTGLLSVFKWGVDAAVDGAQMAWGGAKSVPQRDRRYEAILAREAAILEGTP